MFKNTNEPKQTMKTKKISTYVPKFHFSDQEPTQKALDACQALLKCGVGKKRLTTDYKLVSHNQLIPTESPGKKLASKVKSWENFKEDVTEIKNRVSRYISLFYTTLSSTC